VNDSDQPKTGYGAAKEKEISMIATILIVVGALWAMGFFLFHFVRLLLGRRAF
jgi:uncharacterized membrane protein YuzA (DUF378 family)